MRQATILWPCKSYVHALSLIIKPWRFCEASRQISVLPLPTSLKIPGCQAEYLLPYQPLVPRHTAMDDSVTAYGTAAAARAVSLTSIMSPKWEWNLWLLGGHRHLHHPLLLLRTKWLVLFHMIFKARLWLLYWYSKIRIKIWPDLQV